MSEHTKEPWRIDPDDRPGMNWNNHIVSEADPNIAVCFMAHDGTVENIRGEANARRIVACVNACEGIQTETLEQQFAGKILVGSGVQLWMSYTDKKAEVEDLKQQRDELLAALEIYASMSEAMSRPAREAIAKVKQ